MIYLDSCILIYAVQDGGDRGYAIRRRLAAVDTDLAISPLVELECLVKPLSDGDWAVVDAFRDCFLHYRMIEPTREAYRRAAELRAAHRLKTIDALHLAVAQLNDCDEIWTNDHRFTGVDPAVRKVI